MFKMPTFKSDASFSSRPAFFDQTACVMQGSQTVFIRTSTTSHMQFGGRMVFASNEVLHANSSFLGKPQFDATLATQVIMFLCLAGRVSTSQNLLPTSHHARDTSSIWIKIIPNGSTCLHVIPVLLFKTVFLISSLTTPGRMYNTASHPRPG